MEHTDISSHTSENVPPSMQLQDEGPWHPHAAFCGGEGGADCVVDVPDCEAGDEDYLIC